MFAAIAAILAVAATTSPAPASVQRQTQSSPTAFADVPKADQTNISEYPVLQRLGRWDGTAFQPVPAASISAGHAVFISHGWSTGYQASYDKLQKQQSSLVTLWTPGLVDTKNNNLVDIFAPVARALQQADPSAAIVMFSWVDQSATDNNPLNVRKPEMATEVNGSRMAAAVDEALAPNFYSAGGQVHLIGHSFGANVATTAALAMTVPPRQLTLLDSPEKPITELGGAMNDLRYKLPRLDIGRGQNQTFVDNFISFVGTRYGTFPGIDQIVDVRVTPPPSDGAGQKHAFAIEWYRTSAEQVWAGVGYGWSPLLRGGTAALGSYYEQRDATKPTTLTEVDKATPPNSATQLLVSTSAVELQQRRGYSSASNQSETGGALGAPIVVDGAGVWSRNLHFTTTKSALWLTGSLDLAGAPGDLASVFIDGRQRYQTAVPATGRGSLGLFTILYDVPAGDHVLSVALSGPDSKLLPAVTTSATISNLRVSSTTDVERNLTSKQTNRLLIGVLIAVGVVLLLVLGLVFFLLRKLWRRVHQSAGDPEEPDDTDDTEAEPEPETEPAKKPAAPDKPAAKPTAKTTKTTRNT